MVLSAFLIRVRQPPWSPAGTPFESSSSCVRFSSSPLSASAPSSSTARSGWPSGSLPQRFWCSAASHPPRPARQYISPRSAPHSPRACRTGSSRTSTGRSWPSSVFPAPSVHFSARRVLSSLSTEDAAPLMAAILLAIGVYVLLRFSLRTPPAVVGGGSKLQRQVPDAARIIRRVHRRVRRRRVGARDHQHAAVAVVRRRPEP